MMPTLKQYKKVAEALWEVNKESHIKLAQASHAACPLVKPHADIPGLPQLLTDLQKRSFLFGSIATFEYFVRMLEKETM